jgi:glycine cleavage system H protein
MSKWKTVRVRQELMAAVEKTLDTGAYKSFADFVSEAIQLRLNELEKAQEKTVESPVQYPVIRERLLSSSHHLWTMVTPEGNIRVGLTEYAQGHLKGILNIHTEPTGSDVHRDKPFGSVETWMFKFDLYAPVSGKIANLNTVVQKKPDTINEDPYEAGWIAEIRPNNVVTLEEELRDLMSPKQYKMWALKLRHFARLSPRTPK